MPSLGIAPAPRRIAARPVTSHRRGRRRLRVRFRRARNCAFWRLGFRQSGFRHITRASRRKAPCTWALPPVFWHAVFPEFTLSGSGQPLGPEISPLISARCAGYTAVRLMAHSGLPERRPGFRGVPWPCPGWPRRLLRGGAVPTRTTPGPVAKPASPGHHRCRVMTGRLRVMLPR